MAAANMIVQAGASFNARQLHTSDRRDPEADVFFMQRFYVFSLGIGQTFGVGAGFWVLTACSAASFGAASVRVNFHFRGS